MKRGDEIREDKYTLARVNFGTDTHMPPVYVTGPVGRPRGPPAGPVGRPRGLPADAGTLPAACAASILCKPPAGPADAGGPRTPPSDGSAGGSAGTELTDATGTCTPLVIVAFVIHPN